MKHTCFYPASVLLPDFTVCDGEKYACIACDQFTAEPDYWKEAEEFVGDAPSALHMILPECFLDERAERIPSINAEMRRLLNAGFFCTLPDSMVLVERTCPDGRCRRGLIGMVDLELYSYEKDAALPIRATEGTVLERIPPRVEIRREAPLELPHIMLLIDDPGKTVVEAQAARCESFTPLYDFDLMLGGGHIRGMRLDNAGLLEVETALSALTDPAVQEEKYGSADRPLLFAVGDGNHSLATAKACYEAIKTAIGKEAAAGHPSRFALCEIVNLHDPALDFEPIYRVVFGAKTDEITAAFRSYADRHANTHYPAQTFTVLHGAHEISLTLPHGTYIQPIGTLQAFLDEYLPAHPGLAVDYIHDETSLRALASRRDTVGFLFSGMKKEDLFPAIAQGGALPRKTFSMGHARDKRYYLEARRIRP